MHRLIYFCNTANIVENKMPEEFFYNMLRMIEEKYSSFEVYLFNQIQQ